MKSKGSTVFVGIALILVGILAIAGQMGYFENQTSQFWTISFAGLSVFFLFAYILNGLRAWGWLFPTLISGAVALTIYLGESGIQSSVIGVPILVAVGLPFVVAFAFDPGAKRWALIPAWVMGILSGVLVMADRIQGEWVAFTVLMGIALPFLLVFVLDRSRWWALIPAYVLGVIAFIPLFAENFKGEYVGGMINIMIALPFIAIYFANRKAWWAIIPGGVLFSIGLMIIIIGIFSDSERVATIATSLMFLGWAATFFFVWLRHAAQPADWAKYLAAGFTLLAFVVFLGGFGLEIFWAFLLIVAGLALLYSSLRRGSTDA